MFFGLGLTTSSTATVISRFESLRSKFAARVVQSGGTVENSACLATDIRDLTAAHPDDRVIVISLQKRVAQNGGRVEDVSCLETDVAALDVAYSTDQALLNAFVSRVVLDGGNVQDSQGGYDDIDALT
jgi:hypothetical protein|tara:strand:+ start:533 stop:916 length:384 start_codon:yes stop_codon:yes gene_type:complete